MFRVKNLVFAGVATLIFIASNLIMGSASACSGFTCNDKDPKEQGCDKDAFPVPYAELTNLGTYSAGWFNEKERARYVVLMYSPKCNANWVKVDAERGTIIFIEEDWKDEDLPLGAPKVPSGRYTTEINGQSYGNMGDGSRPVRACAIFPGNPATQCTQAK
jgi:Protein of unknown function (DUF2690)